jgi:hypothetical protein
VKCASFGEEYNLLVGAEVEGKIDRFESGVLSRELGDEDILVVCDEI